MKKIILILMVVLMSASVVFAAATMTSTSSSRVLTSIDADYTFSGPLYVGAIVFIPGAAGDKVVLKHDSASGAAIVTMTSGDGEERVFYPPVSKMTPMLDYSECTLSAGATVIFYIK